MELGAIRRPLRAKTTQHRAEVAREDVGGEWEGMQASDCELSGKCILEGKSQPIGLTVEQLLLKQETAPELPAVCPRCSIIAQPGTKAYSATATKTQQIPRVDRSQRRPEAPGQPWVMPVPSRQCVVGL